MSAVVEIPHGNDAAPPDELGAIAKDLTSDVDLFEIAFPYLVKHRIHPECLARRLRLLCGIDRTESSAWILEPPRDHSNQKRDGHSHAPTSRVTMKIT